MAYLCSHCRRSYACFRLSCPDCGAWNTLRQRPQEPSPEESRPTPLPKIRTVRVPRTTTKIEQLDALLGEGFVQGSSVLLVGTPGAGKSTLVMQVLKSMNVPSLYVTGEESVQQLKLRADRLKINSGKMYLLFETNVNRIVTHADALAMRVLVIDSVQTVYTDASDTLPGSSTQIRKCTYILRRFAQRRNMVLLVVGQVTKQKSAAGPKLLEHAVDVVLSLEIPEGKEHRRILSASKNRYGSTAPRCTLEMRRTGLVFLPVPRRQGHGR